MPRAVVFDETGAPDVLQVVDEPVTEPSPGEVRVKIEAVGVNRLDQLMRSGAFPRPFQLPHARLGCEGTADAGARCTGTCGSAFSGTGVRWTAACVLGALPRRWTARIGMA